MHKNYIPNLIGEYHSINKTMQGLHSKPIAHIEYY